MVIFAAVAMIVTVISGFVFLASTDWAKDEPSDPQFYLFFAMIGFGVPIIWSAMNLALLMARRQTGGQYVAAIHIEREDGAALSRAAVAGWWFCFNPLLFSWPMGLIVGLTLSAFTLVALSTISLFVFGVIFVVCAATPLIALFSAMIDDHNRALHDRIIGIVAVPAE